jgi:hypothetical protein
MRRLLAALAVLVAFVAAGCGLGAGVTPGSTSLLVTQGFGEKVLLDTQEPKISGEDTVMRMLDRNAEIKTRYGGKFVQTIDGVSGGRQDGLATDWIYYINGVQADEGAASVKLKTGDSLWWDNHPWETSTVDAVIGQYPEPFRHGTDGKRLPVRVECVDPNGPDCRKVQNSLLAADVPAFRARLVAQLEQDTLRVVVGPYQKIRGDRGVSLLDDGPQVSGVFVLPNSNGSQLGILDPAGKQVESIGAGSGLIAAVKPPKEKKEIDQPLPVWMVTGTNAAGVSAAAAAFNEETLSRKFALAITADGRGIGLPKTR